MVNFVNIASPDWSPADSYGRIARELMQVLQSRDVWVNQFGGNLPERMKIKPALGGFLLGYPTLHNRYHVITQKGSPRVAITMFEATVIPAEWIEPLNACDAVIVPSQFLVDVFRDCGVTTPIHVVPLGISEAFHKPVLRQRSKPFTFLCIGDRGTRKGWWDTARAFNMLFGDDMNYRLVIKSRTFHITLTNPNIEIIEDDYTDEQMCELYQRAHVLMFPTKGEGFGFPPREMAATGGVAMATNWSGTADDIDCWGVPMQPIAMEQAFEDHNVEFAGRVGQWAAPFGCEGVAAYMQHVVDDYEQYAKRAFRQASWVHEHYRWSDFVDGCWRVYESLL